MGQKVHPKALRLGYIKDWDSRWFSLRDMPDLIEEDQRIRSYLKDKLKMAAVSKVCIERAGSFQRINIFTARPGIVIGKRGSEIESLRKSLEESTGRKTFVNVMEIKKPEMDAQLIAESVALQLERKIGYRRALKKSIEKAMGAGAQGIKIMVGGRLGGSEIARSEWMREGRIPLQTMRADIDYGFAESRTTMGQIGVKVWVFKKELFRKTEKDLYDEAQLVEKEKIEEYLQKPAQEKKEADKAKEIIIDPAAVSEAANEEQINTDKKDKI